MSHPETDAPLGAPPTEAGGLETQRLHVALQRRLFSASSPPVRIGRFEIETLLGEGGMGTVYRARDPELDRSVAVKVLRGSIGADENAANRMMREAQALARLNHPNVLTVLDVGLEDGCVFLAMELVEGGTLLDWSRAHPPGERGRTNRALELAIQAARGLVAAHAAGIVHRDLKPHNMLLGRDGRLRLADFGLAHLVGSHRSEQTLESPHDESDTGHDEVPAPLTRTGQIMGTPAYMAPEQLEGRSDERSDQFSLCASIWEVVFGKRPFAGVTISELWTAIARRRPSEPAVGTRAPRRLRRVLARGLAPDPEDRYPDMKVLLAALQRMHAPARWWPRGALAAVAGAATLLAVSWNASFPTAMRRCTREADRAEQAWNDARRTALRRHFAGARTGETTFERFADVVDRYVGAWTAARIETCEDASSLEERSETALDRRMTCLDDRIDALDTLLDAFAEAELDVATLDNAVPAASDLPGVETCTDDDALAAEIARPAEPWRRTMVDALEHERLQLRARARLGRHAGLVYWAGDLARRADATGYDPLIARVHAELARRQFFDMSPEAEASFEHALQAALRSGAHRPAILTGLAFAELLSQSGQLERAHRQLRQAEALIPRVGGDPRELQARVATARAEVLEHSSELAEAAAQIETQIALDEARVGPDHPSVGNGLRKLAWLRMQLGELEGAREAATRALAILVDAYGPEHLDAATVRSALGAIARQEDRQDDALEHFEAALEIARGKLDPDHPMMAQALANVGAVHYSLGHREQAIAAHRRTLEIMRRAYPPEHRVQVQQRVNLASMMLDQPKQAEPLLIEAIELARAHMGADSLALGHALSAYADMLDRAGRHEEALEILEEALPIHEATGRADRVITDRTEQALALTELGRVAEAEDAARAALERAASIHDTDSTALARPYFALGRALLEAGRAVDALQPASRAVELWAGASNADERAAAAFVLARIRWTLGEPETARRLARRARDEAKAELRGKIERWLRDR